MAAMEASDVTDGPVLSLINKRLRGLRKKYNRILQMEESVAQGKVIHKEQEEVLRSKPSICASIDELEKLRQPLAAAVAKEISLAVQRHQVSAPPSVSTSDSDVVDDKEEEPNVVEIEPKAVQDYAAVEGLLNLLYFATMFDVKSQNAFTSMMLTRTHERGCCLTYDYVTDDATDLLGERDLDLISMLGNLLISRPVDSSLSHRNALQQCIERAKQWLASSDEPIDSDSNVTYAGLRAKLNKIMSSDYFTTTPEMKATVEMAAAAAGGNYGSFQVPVHGSVVPVQEEGSDEQHQQKDEDPADFQGNEMNDNQHPLKELQKGEFQSENPTEIPVETEPGETQVEEQNEREVESKEKHYASRRKYQSQGGGRGRGGCRGYPNGRGGRGSSRGGGAYLNGHNQYYDQAGNYYPRSYYNNRGRGGKGGGGGNFYHHHSPGGAHANHVSADS